MSWDNQKTEDLLGAVILLRTKAEAKKFLRDLLTEEELMEFGKRWEVAKLLHKKMSYIKIVEKTGLSSTTVARVSRWLHRGMGGYKLILERLKS